MKSGIYVITNCANGKEYVGRTKDLEKRELQHWRSLQNGSHVNNHLQKAYSKYGRDTFCFAVLEYCYLTDATIREQWWIDFLDTANSQKGYNLKGLKGIDTHSEETRAKISAANKRQIISPEHRQKISMAKLGKPLSAAHRATMVGRVVSEETKVKLRNVPISESTRAKMSAAHKGKSLSTEHRAKMAVVNKGKVLSPEHRAKLSAAGKGRIVSSETRKKISAANKGRKDSVETRVRKSTARLGDKNPVYGKIRSPETRAKISATRLRNKEARLAVSGPVMDGAHRGSEVGEPCRG